MLIISENTCRDHGSLTADGFAYGAIHETSIWARQGTSEPDQETLARRATPDLPRMQLAVGLDFGAG